MAKLAQEYQGRVDVWEINDDNCQGLLCQLKVYGVPTLIGYHNGEEIARYLGVKPKSELRSLFESLSIGEIPKSERLLNWDRMIRLMTGTLVAGAAWINHSHWSILGIGALVVFSTVYDRCPIWKAITAQFKKTAMK